MTPSTFNRLCVRQGGGSDALTKYIDEFGKLERKAKAPCRSEAPSPRSRPCRAPRPR